MKNGSKIKYLKYISKFSKSKIQLEQMGDIIEVSENLWVKFKKYINQVGAQGGFASICIPLHILAFLFSHEYSTLNLF